MAIEFVFIVFIGIAILYVLIIGAFIYGFWKIKPVKANDFNKSVSVSIILPFFNEKEHIRQCIQSVLQQKTENVDWELIAVNDGSNDGSNKIVEKLIGESQKLKSLHNPSKGKKQALQFAINQSTKSLIITIDADCFYPSGWLQTMVDAYRQTNAKLLIGPVKMVSIKSWIHRFQQIDFMSLVGSGAGAAGLGRPVMCNGANLAFERQAYLQLTDPLRMDYLSGDDVFLLHAIKSDSPDKIHFVKHRDAVAETKPVDRWQQFIRQRSRWAGKTAGYTDIDSLIVAGLVALTALGIVVGGILTFFIPSALPYWLILFVSKLVIDCFFLSQISRFFTNKISLIRMPVFELVFCFYVALIVVLFPFKSNNAKW